MTEFPSTKRVGILVFDGFEPIDVYGPIEAFAISRFIGTGYYSKPPHPFDIKLITNQTQPTGGGTPTPVRSYYNGPKVLPDLFRDQALGFGIDVLLIPGGAGVRNLLNGSKDEVDTLLEWVNDMNEEVELMTSVCTGSAVLAKSGILDGKRATTNHEAFAWVTQFGGKVKWDNVARWVHDDHYVTSAGVSASCSWTAAISCARASARALSSGDRSSSAWSSGGDSSGLTGCSPPGVHRVLMGCVRSSGGGWGGRMGPVHASGFLSEATLVL